VGCGGSGGSGGSYTSSVNDAVDTNGDVSGVTDEIDDSSPDGVISINSPWIINTSERSRQIFESESSNTGVLEDVQLVEELTVDSVSYVYVEATGIPNYDIPMTQTIVDELNNRPKASSDFGAGVTSANAGDIVEFGQDIGYNSSTENCGSTGGAGYWPPGPGCPIHVGKAEYFTLSPLPTTSACATGLGTTGAMVNGTSIFNWGDGMSYGNNVWYTLAPVAEQYDVDICGGHAAQGEYHHHFYTSCLADLVGDDGTTHSPIYGYAADGYPLYGPWESADNLALSGWQTRDYGAALAEGGCNTPDERTCTLVNEYDVNQGVDTSVGQGPDIGQTVTTLSGNILSADNGYYYEDYYYAQAAATGEQLDQHNGHDNDDGRGYHYHITLVDDGSGKLTPAFPYTIGPSFYGALPDNAATSCGGVAAGGGAPPPPPG
tara:strand:- start:250330 stop:251628 length:1299 start_codon:yes stop_codon:yes gene_type:complete